MGAPVLSGPGMVLTGDKEMVAWLQKWGGRFKATLKKALLQSAMIGEAEAKRQVYLGHPQHLQGDKGHLRRAITHSVDGDGQAAYVGVLKGFRYGRIHELGGIILPKKGKYLVFWDKRPESQGLNEAAFTKSGRISTSRKAVAANIGAAGHLVFVKQVTIPARPYIMPALRDKAPEIKTTFENILEEDIKQ